MSRPLAFGSGLIVVAGVAALLNPVPATAQPKYPTKPIRLVVAFSAGGTPDTLARLLGPKMSEHFGQPVVVENRPGAGGTIAAALVARATPDGYTLLATSPGFAVSAAIQTQLPYDPVKDFAGVAQIGYSTTVLVVGPQLGIKSVKELIALARAQPGKVLFGSAGAGSATHMNGERFRLAAGIKVQHVGFKGQPEFLIEVAAGRIHYGVGGLGPMLGLIRDGRLVPLAVAIDRRTPVLPDVPAAPEVLSGWNRNGSQVWLAPAATPRAVVNALNSEVARILALPDVKQRLETIDFHMTPVPPDEVTRNLRTDIEVFTKIARESGLRPQ